MAEQKKFKVTKQQLVNMCIQMHQSGMGKMEFDSIEEKFNYFAMFVEQMANLCGWEVEE